MNKYTVPADVRREGAGDVVGRLAAICGPSMQQCQCRSDQSDCVACTCGHAVALITTLRATIARLSDELETERMRLVACGVVAMSNTTESAAKNRDMHPSYRSASCDDVARAVDREMALRAEVERLRAAIAHWVQAAS